MIKPHIIRRALGAVLVLGLAVGAAGMVAGSAGAQPAEPGPSAAAHVTAPDLTLEIDPSRSKEDDKPVGGDRTKEDEKPVGGDRS